MENITLFSHYWVGKSQLRAKQIESMPLFAYFLLLNHNGERSEPKIFRKWLSLLTECLVVESVRAERAEKIGNMQFFFILLLNHKGERSEPKIFKKCYLCLLNIL